MTFAVNQLAQILISSVPYRPRLVEDLASDLYNCLHKKVAITYTPRASNKRDRIIDSLELFETKKGYDFNKNHTHNIVTLHLKERKTMFFIDGDGINSNVSASTSGFIHRVEILKSVL